MLGSAQGEFTLHSDNDRDMLCIAAGTGLSPIEAIIHESIALGRTRPIHLFYGARKQADFYHLEELAKWSQQYPQILMALT